MGNTTLQKLWGWAVEYTSLQDQTTAEWWGDWAPNSDQPSFIPTSGNNTGNNTQGGNNTDGTSSGKKTPGFEVLPVLAAVAIAAILLRRRR
jgi:PGF-CTERM protein